MNVVITGASRGIGLELATQALERGDRVLAAVRDPEGSTGLLALRKRHEGRLESVAVDFLDPEAPARIAQAVASWPCVDVLIGNAGIYKKSESAEDFLDSFRVNSVAPLKVAQALLPKLKASKSPRLAQITSLMGSIKDNTSGGSIPYRASKAALNMATRSLAQDETWLPTAVIHPGWVKTAMGGKEAPIEPKDSARGIWKVIDSLTVNDRATFYDFEGDRLPW